MILRALSAKHRIDAGQVSEDILTIAAQVHPRCDAMTAKFKRGDHVEWNAEAGRVRGTII